MYVQVGPKQKQNGHEEKQPDLSSALSLYNQSNLNRKHQNGSQHGLQSKTMMHGPHACSCQSPRLPDPAAASEENDEQQSGDRDFEPGAQCDESGQSEPVIEARHDDFEAPAIGRPGKVHILREDSMMGDGVLGNDRVSVAQMPPQIGIVDGGNQRLQMRRPGQQNHQRQTPNGWTFREFKKIAHAALGTQKNCSAPKGGRRISA